MRPFRPIIAAVIMLAMMASPLAAALAPCCCSSQEASKCPLCLARVAFESEIPPAHCPSCAKQPGCKNQAAGDKALSVAPAGCACVKAQLPVAMTRDKASSTSTEQHLVATPVDSTVNDTVSTVRRFIPCLAVTTPTGPPLLALYCIWLK